MSDPFAMAFEQPSGNTGMTAMAQVPANSATDKAMAEVFTAQRVQIKRNLPAILQEARALATANGAKFYYSIPFKNRKKGTTEYVEGPTIGCTMAALNIYGNCRVEAFPAETTPTHWTFMARFVDYEKGVTVTRAFQQRRGQDTGMGDGGRAADIVFQIGQSKAIRNVIAAALGWLVDEMEVSAKAGIVERIGKNPDGARAYLVKELAALEIDLPRVERVVGRAAAKWLAPDMAKLHAQIASMRDGMADSEDLFPSSVAAGEELAEANQAENAGEPVQHKQEDKPAPKQRKAAPKAEAPKEEPKPAVGEQNSQTAAAAETTEKVAEQAQSKPSPTKTAAAAKPVPEEVIDQETGEITGGEYEQDEPVPTTHDDGNDGFGELSFS